MSESIICSMTGFARLKKTIQGIDAVISLKSVNHRGLDLHFHMSSDLDPFEAAVLGVHMHGLAGDLARDAVGEVSLIATDLLVHLPHVFGRLAFGN